MVGMRADSTRVLTSFRRSSSVTARLETSLSMESERLRDLRGKASRSRQLGGVGSEA